jgi:SAM-dependent methyltransferase
MPLPPVHLAILQPEGYLHAQGFLDQARYLRYQFRRLGAEVTLAKNRLREDAVNLVFGAHLGFPPEWQRRHACLFVNLEQLGQGGASVRPEYLELLRRSAVVDYDAANIAAYGQDPDDVPLISFAHAPYLDQPSPPLEERPIDLLFFGSMNPRRQAFLARIEACGVTVSSFDHPLYGEERDHFLRQAKAVVNCHFYETSRFEQARAFHCLSLGTPFISERAPQACPPAAFEPAVFWLDDARLESFFRTHFGTPAFYAEARARLAAFRQVDPVEQYADLLAFATGLFQAHTRTRPVGPWRPERLNLTDGEAYQPGWLNVSDQALDQPDLLAALPALPLDGRPLATAGGAQVQLAQDSLAQVRAGAALQSTADLPALMDRLLQLLREGGELVLEVPARHGPLAARHPGRRRDFDDNSWLPFTEQFWRSGWLTHRFEVASGQWVDLQRQPCAKPQAVWLQLTLRKVGTTARERTVARAHRTDFGDVPEDILPAWRDADAPDACPASPAPLAT